MQAQSSDRGELAGREHRHAGRHGNALGTDAIADAKLPPQSWHTVTTLLAPVTCDKTFGYLLST